MANKGPQTLLLTTKDGQQTMVVQQPSVSVADCNVTTAVLNNTHTSSSPQVITINKPLTQNSGVPGHPQQPIIVPNMVLNMNNMNATSRPTYVNAVNNQTPQRGLAPRVLLNSSPQIRLTPQMITTQRAPGAQNVMAPVNYHFHIYIRF